MTENKCASCPIYETCPERNRPIGIPFVYDYNDCLYWSCPQIGKPSAQRALRNPFKQEFNIIIDGKKVVLVRFGSIHKPTSYTFSIVQRAVDCKGNIYVCKLGGQFKPNGQNAFDIRGK